MKNLFQTIVILLSLTTISVKSEEYNEIFIDDLVAGHYEVLEDLTLEELGFFRSHLASLMDKFSKGKLSDDMLKYFTNDLQASRHFLKAYYLAEGLSKEICGLSEESKRRALDEVDAIRHFIWSSYLTYHLGEKRSREILSLQEKTTKLDNANKMDLYNNERGIQFAKSILKKRRTRQGRIKHRLNKHIQEQYALEYLDEGLFKVIKSKDSACKRDGIYPNY